MQTIKRANKKHLALLLAVTMVVMAVALPITANAATGSTKEMTTSYTTVISSSTGLNRDINIITYTSYVTRIDIRMLGRNGQVVWEEEGAIEPGTSRWFWCGSDVYEVQIKCKGFGGFYNYEY